MVFRRKSQNNARAVGPHRTLSRGWLTAAAGAAIAVAVAGAVALGVAFSGGASAGIKPHATTSGQPSAVPMGIADPDLFSESATVQASQLAAMKAIGINSVRLDANWAWVQYGGPKSFDWAQMDRMVKTARAAGMSVDLIIDGCPQWAALAGTSGAASPQPASSTEYATWAAQVAARYAPQGVGTFEILE